MPVEEERLPPDFYLDDAAYPSTKAISPQRYESTPAFRDARAIVIDLGSSALRAGFSSSKDPTLELPPMVARMRDPDTGIRTFLIGNDALVSSARSTARPAYESGIPNNPALMERLLDGTLVNLGLAEQDSISHSFMLTEAPCQPNSARALMMEILFEAYITPSVCFGIDALFSYFYNRHVRKPTSDRDDGRSIYEYAKEDALVVSCGYNSTHVLPVVSRRLEPERIKRINVGGMHMTDQLARRLQLLHTDHSSVLTSGRVELLKEKVCYVSEDYDGDLHRLSQDVDFYNGISKSVKVPIGDAAEKPALSPEEQERLRQARVENGKRLSEMMKEKRRARAASKEKTGGEGDAEDASYTEEEVAPLYDALDKWYEMQRIEEIREIDEDKFYCALLLREMDKAGLERELETRQEELDVQREKLGEGKRNAAEEAWWKRIHEDELLSMSDSELNASELKKKRHVRAMRGAAEARVRAKRAKEAEKAEEERKKEELRKMKEERPKEYLKMLMEERTVLAGRIKKREAAREAGSDRRSQAARERMRLLAQHAGSKASVDGEGRARGRGRGRGGGRGRGRGKGRGGRGGKGGRAGKKVKVEDEEEDNFGWNDSDWDVYRAMKVGGESDSDDNSAEERERLETVRGEINEIAPDDVDPTVSHPEGVALLYEEDKYGDEIAVVVDRIRTGEMLFQPTLAGVEQCGLAEAIWMSAGERSSVVKEVFVTGGVARMGGLRERLGRELRRLFPTEMGDEIVAGVRVADDPSLDAWRGAALFAQEGGDAFEAAAVTRAMWEEMGPGYLREHAFGNLFYPTPVLSAAEIELKKKLQKQASKRGRPRGLFA